MFSLTQRSRTPNRSKAALAAVAVLAFGVATSACSAPETKSAAPGQRAQDVKVDQASMDKAKANIEALKAEPAYNGPTTPIDLSKVRGKTIYFIAFDLSNAFNETLLNNFKEAAKLMDVKVVGLNGKVNAALETTYVNQAVKANAAAIVLLSVGAEQVSAALRNAADAGIPVITMAQHSAGDDPGKNITNQVTVSTTDIGKAQADLAYVTSKGYVNAIGYGGASLPQDVSQMAGQEARIKELCPEVCSYKRSDVNLANFQTQLPGIARAAITGNQKLNWFFPTWDILGGYLVPGIQQAGMSKTVQFSSWNGIPAAMKLVSEGKQAATFGVPLRWWSWATLDMAARYIAGQDVAPDAENLPVRMFTKDVLDEAGSLDDESALFGDDHAFEKYKELWSVS
jgi:ribose transport system substrate-binding protein